MLSIVVYDVFLKYCNLFLFFRKSCGVKIFTTTENIRSELADLIGIERYYLLSMKDSEILKHALSTNIKDTNGFCGSVHFNVSLYSVDNWIYLLNQYNINITRVCVCVCVCVWHSL